ncbi:MAG: 50S ribosomal protein L11 methyltransferase [Bacteroidota bacterium]
MSYLVYELRFDPATVNEDELVALLSLGGFEGFEQTEGLLDAYLPIERGEEAEIWLAKIQLSHPFSYTVEELPDKNWNAEWEANFSPIQIGNWLGIRAGFHQPMPDLELEIVIDPKMAFGTGHHATTHMMCELMNTLSWSGKKVFDYGCGTGILSILAKKLGAEMVYAIDIERASYENTLENAETNEVVLDRVFCGDLAAFDSDFRRLGHSPNDEILARSLEEQGTGSKSDSSQAEESEMMPPAEVQNKQTPPLYDIILANINRGVILDSLGPLKKRLLPAGQLLVSGILKTDAALVLNAADKLGFKTVSEQQRGDWMAWIFEA